MPAIPAFQYDSDKEIFGLLERQFSIGEDVLVGLTKAFLDEFKLGLSEYNHDMAMM